MHVSCAASLWWSQPHHQWTFDPTRVRLDEAQGIATNSKSSGIMSTTITLSMSRRFSFRKQILSGGALAFAGLLAMTGCPSKEGDTPSGADAGSTGGSGGVAFTNPPSSDGRGVWVGMIGTVASVYDSGLLRINPDTYAVEAKWDSSQLPTATTPEGLPEIDTPRTLVACGDALWIGNLSRTVTRVDIRENRVTDSLVLTRGMDIGACFGDALWGFHINGPGPGPGLNRVDMATRKETADVPVTTHITALVGRGNELWVGNYFSISERNVVTGEETGRGISLVEVQVPGEADERPMMTLGMASDGVSLWALGSSEKNDVSESLLVRVDVTTGAKTQVVKLGGETLSDNQVILGDVPAVAAAGGRIWAVNRATKTLLGFDMATGKQIATIPTGKGPSDIAIGFGKVWVSNREDTTLLVVDEKTAAVLQTIALSPFRSPFQLAITGN